MLIQGSICLPLPLTLKRLLSLNVSLFPQDMMADMLLEQKLLIVDAESSVKEDVTRFESKRVLVMKR